LDGTLYDPAKARGILLECLENNLKKSLIELKMNYPIVKQ
jgi:hypothetical protein